MQDAQLGGTIDAAPTVNDAEPVEYLDGLCLRLVVSGAELIQFDRWSQQVPAGTLFIIPAGVRHRVAAAMPDTASIVVRVTERALAAELRRHRHGLTLADIRTMPPFGRLITDLDSDDAGLRDPDGERLRLLGCALEALAAAKTSIAAISAQRPHVRRELFRRAALARSAVEQDPERDWSTEALARIACISPFHFRRVFRAAFDLTPVDFVRTCRAARARHLLRATDVPIGEIAYRVGYENFPAFSRWFRAETGFTPTEYRRAVGGGAPLKPSSAGYAAV